MHRDEPVHRVVAEALAPVRDPVAAAIRWPATAPAPYVRAGLAALAAPHPAGIVTPSWLLPDQHDPARRLVTMLRDRRGALLARPTGSGKTFVALAAAACLRGGGPVAVAVPAPIREQWVRRAAACGIPVAVLSHTALSRGHLPPESARVVIVDECHHFRYPTTRRYHALAEWAVGRAVLGVTATPVVGRMEDVAHQLLLGVRDDTLAASGTPSLLAALRGGTVPPALSALILAGGDAGALPARTERVVRWAAAHAPPAWSASLEALDLSGRSAVRRLVRGVLWHAAASSPAALRAALGRYQTLLAHAQDARAAGHSVDRSELRRFALEAPEQLVLWELLPPGAAADDLPADDLPRVRELRARIDLAGPDPKADALAEILGAGPPTIVFSTSRATVHYLRERLAALGPAWVDGTGAGWRHLAARREQVLDWFRPDAPPGAPRLLLTSDVAAEGLDLQRAGRVVHYDLPWTPMRLDQREGRARRLGQALAQVEVATFAQPEWVARRLGTAAILGRKARLAAHLSGAVEARPWRWRLELASAATAAAPVAGFAAVEGDDDALLIALEIGGALGPAATPWLGVIGPDGRWSDDGAAVLRVFHRTGDATPMPVTDDLRLRWVAPVTALVRALLRAGREAAWRTRRNAPHVAALLERVRRLGRVAARARDDRTAARAEAAQALLARGQTAGERLRSLRAQLLDDEAMLALLADGTTPERPPAAPAFTLLAALAVVPRRATPAR